jgi:hypothetical protein
MDKFQIKVGDKELAIVEHTIKKGRTQGAVFYGPDFEQLGFEEVRAAYGDEKLFNDIILPELRRMANVVTKEAMAEVGNDLATTEKQEQFIARFQEMYGSLSARGLTQKALKERINELTETLSGIKPVFNNGIPDITNPETIRFFKFAQKLQQAQQALEAKKSQDEEDTAEATPANATPAVA